MTLRSRPLRPLRLLGHRRPPREVLAPPWRRWLVENLARGVAAEDLRRVLIDHGVPAGEAARRLHEATQVAAPARDLAAWSRRLETVLRLRNALRAPEVERRSTPDAAEFFARYWQTNTPAIFTDLIPSWPAFKNWSHAWLREHYGHAEIEAEWGRSGDPDCDIRFAQHRRTTTLAEFIDHIAGATANDVYAIANNHNVARPELLPLFDDVEFPAGYVVRERLPSGSALWIGPAGTVTSLHHDTSNILFCQVFGRKRVRLAAPDEPTLLRHTRGVYSRLDPELPGSAWQAAQSYDLTLAPGDALFIPAGWWHHVRALDPSISLAVNAFTRPNNFNWYKPGAPG